MGSHCPSCLNIGCHKIPCYSSWNKTTQSHCQMQWIHSFSEREFLTVNIFLPVTSKKSNVVSPSAYLYICQLRLKWRFSQGLAKETQRKQCPVLLNFSGSRLCPFPAAALWLSCPGCVLHTVWDTLDMLLTNIKCACISGWKLHLATKIFFFSWTLALHIVKYPEDVLSSSHISFLCMHWARKRNVVLGNKRAHVWVLWINVTDVCLWKLRPAYWLNWV